MPKLFMPVPETNESCTRPVVFGIVNDLVEMTGIPKDTTIFYPGDLEKAKQQGSGIEQKSEATMMPFNNRVEIEVEENYDAERYISTAVYGPENLFIFRDDWLDTFIKPVYSSADMTINFKYRAVDKTSAMRWRDNIRTRVSMMWDQRLHTAEYHYLVPPEFLVILKELHRMRENVAPYGEDYDLYFKNNTTKNATVLTTQTGTQSAWGISEKQLRIVGYFDFEGVPEQGSKEDEGDTWTISFAYKFKYDKPIACVMFYPLMIHNQLVDQNFRPNPVTDVISPLNKTDYNYSLSAFNFNSYDKSANPPSIWPGVAIPEFDEFFPSSIPSGTTRVFTALVNIDTTNPLFLLSLRDMGNTVIHPEILNFLVGEVPYLFKPRESVFTLNLYRGIDLLENNTLTIDSNLNINSVSPLSLRHYYHIRLGIVTDLTTINSRALDRLRNNGVAAMIVLNTIDPTLISKGCMPNLLGSNLNANNGSLTNLNNGNNSNGSGSSVGGPTGLPNGSSFNPLAANYITKSAMQLAIDAINSPTSVKGNGQVYGFNTVQSLFITASKLNN